MVQIAWILSKYANVGNYLKLDGDNGWFVKETYNELDDTTISMNDNAIKHMKMVANL